MRLDPINLYDYEARAKQVLPPPLWDYIDGGVLDDSTVRRNRTALDELTLRPRFLRDISKRDISTTVLGEPVSLPVMLSPAGMHMNVHPEGELAAARGAGMSGTLMIVSTVSSYSMEEVSQVAAGPLWFQLYHRSVELTEMLVRRAEEAGFKAICLTVDIPCDHPRNGTTVLQVSITSGRSPWATFELCLAWTAPLQKPAYWSPGTPPPRLQLPGGNWNGCVR